MHECAGYRVWARQVRLDDQGGSQPELGTRAQITGRNLDL